ncbi:hypothetical protein [Paracraurococcus lichenis]|uniref:Uncharacterized protein n=1 Tax=Paracraurococcus lichenis TaxID=3064888 RepID=A0ABT9ED72_9PROT|nr:hypothetical protein [Paracraurococcus sp. LOR1-02]MDO9713835.1 hypothetical protein [Paracraurococcus sp. LOR1-02]
MGFLTDLASLGLTLAKGKRFLADVQQEIVAAQARIDAVRRPACRGGGDVCRVEDYRQHALRRLYSASCGVTETGLAWPRHIRSTPELDRLRAHLSALVLSVGAGADQHLGQAAAMMHPTTSTPPSSAKGTSIRTDLAG